MNDYPRNWQEIAQSVKDAAGWRCEQCGHPHDIDAGYMLTVHHLDGDKANYTFENLVALCQRCHLRVQARYHPAQTVMPFYVNDWMRRRGLTWKRRRP